MVTRYRREVEREYELRAAFPRQPLTQKREHAFRGVVRLDPAESFPRVLAGVQLRVVAVQAVERPIPREQLLVMRMRERGPREILVIAPLVPLPELTAHEHELLAGMRELVAEQQPVVPQLAPLVARHFVEQRALAVHHLVV